MLRIASVLDRFHPLPLKKGARGNERGTLGRTRPQDPFPPGRSTHLAKVKYRSSGRVYVDLAELFLPTQRTGSVEVAGDFYQASRTRDEHFVDLAGLRLWGRVKATIIHAQ